MNEQSVLAFSSTMPAAHGLAWGFHGKLWREKVGGREQCAGFAMLRAASCSVIRLSEGFHMRDVVSYFFPRVKRDLWEFFPGLKDPLS